MEGLTRDRFSRPVPIDSAHDTSSFACGNEVLDDWLKNIALKAENRSARTYVVCEGAVVVGYYCLATGSVARSAAPGKIRRNVPDPVPVMILGRLAVDARCKGQGIGGGMVNDALRRVLQAAGIVGCRAVLVHAVDDRAMAFYATHGFVEHPGGSRTMFLPVETIQRAL